MKCDRCGQDATWARDDDIPYCDQCKEEDESGMAWWRIGRGPMTYGIQGADNPSPESRKAIENIIQAAYDELEKEALDEQN